MATREENLKKINDELEQLSDEELDKVAGGSNFYRYISHFGIGGDNPNTNPDSNQPGDKAACRWV